MHEVVELTKCLDKISLDRFGHTCDDARSIALSLVRMGVTVSSQNEDIVELPRAEYERMLKDLFDADAALREYSTLKGLGKLPNTKTEAEVAEEFSVKHCNLSCPIAKSIAKKNTLDILDTIINILSFSNSNIYEAAIDFLKTYKYELEVNND